MFNPDFERRARIEREVDAHEMALGSDPVAFAEFLALLEKNLNLRKLNLSANNLGDEHIAQIAKLPLLELDFSFNLPTQNGILELVKLNVEKLNLSGCGISEKTAKEIAIHTKQKYLTLEYESISSPTSKSITEKLASNRRDPSVSAYAARAAQGSVVACGGAPSRPCSSSSNSSEGSPTRPKCAAC